MDSIAESFDIPIDITTREIAKTLAYWWLKNMEQDDVLLQISNFDIANNPFRRQLLLGIVQDLLNRKQLRYLPELIETVGITEAELKDMLRNPAIKEIYARGNRY